MLGWTLRLLVLTYTLCQQRHVVDSMIVRAPTNVAVVQGSNVSFSCGSNSSTTNTIRWDFYQHGRFHSATVWNSVRLNDRQRNRGFNVNETSCKQGRTCDVQITNVTLDTAGSIVCFDVDGPDYEASLVVLESETKCVLSVPSTSSSNVHQTVVVDESDKLFINCTVRYLGTWTPIIHCSFNSTSAKFHNAENWAHYSDVIPVTSHLHDRRIQCVTSFDDRNRRHYLTNFVFASNTPDLKLTWQSPAITVRRKDQTASQTTEPNVRVTPSTIVDSTSLELSSQPEPTQSAGAVVIAQVHQATKQPGPGEGSSQQFSFYAVTSLIVLLAACVVVIIVLVFKKRDSSRETTEPLSRQREKQQPTAADGTHDDITYIPSRNPDICEYLRPEEIDVYDVTKAFKNGGTNALMSVNGSRVKGGSVRVSFLAPTNSFRLTSAVGIVSPKGDDDLILPSLHSVLPGNTYSAKN